MKIRRGQAGTRPGNFWIGCLVVVVLAIIALVIGGWYVSANWRSWAAGPMRNGMTALISEAGLPDDEQVALEAEIGGLIDQFESGDLSIKDMSLILEELTDSPMLPAALVMGFDKTYYANNEDLTDEQKEEARKEMSRFITGVASKQIPKTKIDDVLEPISDPNGGVKVQAGNINISIKKPEKTAPDELMEAIANMKAEADEAGIEDKEFVIDIAAEFTKVVDAALGRTPVLSEAPEQPEAPESPEPEGDN